MKWIKEKEKQCPHNNPHTNTTPPLPPDAHTHTCWDTDLQSGTEWDHFILYKSHANACMRTHTHAQTSSLTLSGTTSSSTKAVQTHTCTQMRTHTHTHKPPVWHWAGPLHPRQQPCVFSPVTSANSHKCSSWIKKKLVSALQENLFSWQGPHNDDSNVFKQLTETGNHNDHN